MSLICSCGKEILVSERHKEWLSKYSYFCRDGANVETFIEIGLNRVCFSIGGLILNVPHGMLPDHIDGDIHNNLDSNLRLATFSQNSMNQKLRSNNTSGYKGVSFNQSSGYWYRKITVEGHSFTKRFYSAFIAAIDYDTEARVRFGAFARLNFPLPGERGVC